LFDDSSVGLRVSEGIKVGQEVGLGVGTLEGIDVFALSPDGIAA
jgi:hypothetical protein